MTLAPDPWPLLRPLLFRLDPERAHRLTLAVLAQWSRLPQRPAHSRKHTSSLTREHLGLRFANPVGLAAGLDKDAEAVPAWQALGFGFIEIGTVTAHAQPGNPRPRLFRLPADQALINRMGFNNAGAEAVARRLERLRARGVLSAPLGVNIGKSKITPPEQAAADYRRSFERLHEFADYLVVNISSPNTPGLRDLQTVDEVGRILEAIQQPNQQRTCPRPILVKLAPDLSDEDAIACARAALDGGAAGLILTNTTIRFTGLNSPTEGMQGGLSGRPLFARSTELLGGVRATLGPEPVLVGVGGIFTPEDALAKLDAGADLVQIYTGLIYRGPALVKALLNRLTDH